MATGCGIRAALRVGACSVFGSGMAQSVVPVYTRPESEPPNKFYHDHRYLCTIAGVWAHYPFAKQERYRGIQSKVLQDFSLSHLDLLYNSDKPRHLPLLMSTAYSLAWASQRWAMGLAAGDAVQNRTRWSSLLSAAQDACRMPLSRRC